MINVISPPENEIRLVERRASPEEEMESAERLNSILGKIFSILTFLIPLPFYALIFGLSLEDHDFLHHPATPKVLLLVFFSSLELMNSWNSEEYNNQNAMENGPDDSNQPDRDRVQENRQDIPFISFEFFAWLLTLWCSSSTITRLIRDYVFPADHSETVILACSTVPFYISKRTIHSRRCWTSKRNGPTLLISGGLFVISCFTYILSWLSQYHTDNYLLISLISLLIAQIYQRFIFLFTRPPHWYFAISSENYKSTWSNGYFWFLLLDLTLWAAGFSVISLFVNEEAGNDVLPVFFVFYAISIVVVYFFVSR